MTSRIVIRVLPKEEPNVAEVLKKIFFSGLEGILVPSGVEVASFVKSAADPSNVTVATKGHSPSDVVERRVAIEYSTDQFPLLTLLDPENEMVPEPAEREDLALHLLNTVATAHRIGLYHGQLNSERVFVHSDEPICYLSDFFVGKSYNPYICPRDYRGPESILRCGDTTTEKVDVWGMGCLLYELLSTEPLFMLPSSKDDVGVTAPVLVMRQVVAIVARVAAFPTNQSPEGRGEGYFTKGITDLFAQLKDPQTREAIFKTMGSDQDQLRYKRDRLADGTISEPFAWAIQQCLTFNPMARPSLQYVRDGLLERLGYSKEAISEREAEVVACLERLAAVPLGGGTSNSPPGSAREVSPAGSDSGASNSGDLAANSGNSVRSSTATGTSHRSSAPLVRLVEAINAAQQQQNQQHQQQFHKQQQEQQH